MAQHRVPSGIDPIDFLLRENANLANRVQALEGRRLSTWDRYYHDEVAAPVEGQHVVEPGSEEPWYYSNGAWRQLDATIVVPWIRRSRTFTVTPLTVPSAAGSDVAITYESTDGSTDYTSYFSAPTSSTIRALVEGVYVVMGEYHFDDDTFPEDIHFFLHDELNYPTKLPTVNQISGESGYVAFHWRHRWEAGTDVQITIAQSNASNKDLNEGYTEIHYVGSYTGTDPSGMNPDQ